MKLLIRNTIHHIFKICLISILLSSQIVHANDSKDFLSGPAFTNPSLKAKMSEQWQQQGISRIKWAKGSDIAVTLDQHLYSALLPLIQDYAHTNKLDIAVQEGTCGISAGKLSKKEADIGGFCCPAATSDRLPGLSYHTLAVAPLAILVHADNPNDTLSLQTIRKIFSGEIISWEQLAGQSIYSKRNLIRTIGRLHCKARPGHWRLLLDNENMFSSRLQEVSTIPDMINSVIQNKQAIGYETLWMLQQEKNNTQVKAIKVNGVDPHDTQAMVEGRYPLYRVYNLTTWTADPAINTKANDLLDYLKKAINTLDPRYGLISHQLLRQAGWKFQGDEIIASPTSEVK